MIKRILFPILILFFAFESLCYSQRDQAPTTEELNRAIEEVVQQREYQWRMPREVVDEQEQGLLFDFLQGVANTFKRAWKPIADLWNKFSRWLNKRLSSFRPSDSSEWTEGELTRLIVILIAAAVLLVLFFVWRNRRKKQKTETIHAEPIQPLPDLNRDDVVPDQLPEEGWQRLAQELLARGELRLAMRAFFLATLAYLANAQLITIARFKSNQDYLRELKRRAYDRTALQEAFQQNVLVVDSVWYGMHPVTTDLLNRFRENADTVMRKAA
jgi:hypothetical protein